MGAEEASDTISEKMVETELEGATQKALETTIPRIGLCDDFKHINLYSLMGSQKVCLIVKLWEIMMLNECLLILADTPIICRYSVFHTASSSSLYSQFSYLSRPLVRYTHTSQCSIKK